MTRLSKNAKRMMAVAMSAALAFSGITVQNADAATSKLTVAKSVTVAKGATKNLVIKATGFTVKSVKVKVKGKAATAKAKKKAISVTGVKVGTATVTTTIKAIKKGKKAKTYTFTTAVKVTKANKPVAKTSAEVSTQEELVEALKNKSLTKLTIGQKATTLEIPEGTYENVDLIVDAPNASITNYATFKSIEIKAVAANTFKEKGKNNRLNVTAKKEIHLIIDTIYEVLSLVFKGTAADAPKGASLVEMVSGVLKNMDVTNGDKVDMTASGESKIGGINASEGAQLNLKASGSVTVDEITLKGDGTKGAITSDGNSNVKNVKMGEGKVESSISGDSKNVTTLDITEATKDAKATLNTDSVKISTDENTSVKDVVDNQSGKPVVTETQKSDGTVDTGTKPADGNGGVKQPSGGDSGGSSGSSSPSSYVITLDLSDAENENTVLSDADAASAGFTPSGNRKWSKTYSAGAQIGVLPTPTLAGKILLNWQDTAIGRGTLPTRPADSNMTMIPTWADRIDVLYCASGDWDASVDKSNYPIRVENVNTSTTTQVGGNRGVSHSNSAMIFAGWGPEGEWEKCYPSTATLGQVVSDALNEEMFWDWDETINDADVAVIRMYTWWATEGELIEEALNQITFDDIKGTNTNANSVTSNLSLTSSITVNGSSKDVTWEIGHPDCTAYFDTSTGAVTRDVYYQNISIRPTCTSNGETYYGDWIDFTIPEDTNLRYIDLYLDPGTTITNNPAGFIKVRENTDGQLWRIVIDSTSVTTLGSITLPTVTLAGNSFSTWMYHARDNQEDTSDYSAIATSTVNEQSDFYPVWSPAD